MARDVSYDSIMARKNTIMRNSVGLDYSEFELSSIAFDYEGLMETVGLSLEEVSKIQRETNVGNTPLVELRNVTRLVRKLSPKGKGARIFVKDEAANPSGSFKDRRASISVYYAEKRGYEGVIAATSGNYGAAVAAQAAKRGLSCIIIQEAFDSRGVGQPEILEKARKCEAYGAEVLQLSVGPELFYCLLRLLEETGYFNASLYTPFSVAGIETLGYEIAREIRESEGCDPDVSLVDLTAGLILRGSTRGRLEHYKMAIELLKNDDFREKVKRMISKRTFIIKSARDLEEAFKFANTEEGEARLQPGKSFGLLSLTLNPWVNYYF